MAEDEHRTTFWGTAILTTLIVLSSVGFGVWIYWFSSRRHTGASTPDLSGRITQIRQYIRTANQSTSTVNGLAAASTARALLDDARSMYGDALANACDVNKLYALIQKVESRHRKTLPAMEPV